MKHASLAPPPLGPFNCPWGWLTILTGPRSASEPHGQVGIWMGLPDAGAVQQPHTYFKAQREIWRILSTLRSRSHCFLCTLFLSLFYYVWGGKLYIYLMGKCLGEVGGCHIIHVRVGGGKITLLHLKVEALNTFLENESRCPLILIHHVYYQCH